MKNDLEEPNTPSVLLLLLYEFAFHLFFCFYRTLVGSLLGLDTNRVTHLPLLLRLDCSKSVF